MPKTKTGHPRTRYSRYHDVVFSTDHYGLTLERVQEDRPGAKMPSGTYVDEAFEAAWEALLHGRSGLNTLSAECVEDFCGVLMEFFEEFGPELAETDHPSAALGRAFGEGARGSRPLTGPFRDEPELTPLPGDLRARMDAKWGKGGFDVAAYGLGVH